MCPVGEEARELLTVNVNDVHDCYSSAFAEPSHRPFIITQHRQNCEMRRQKIPRHWTDDSYVSNKHRKRSALWSWIRQRMQCVHVQNWQWCSGTGRTLRISMPLSFWIWAGRRRERVQLCAGAHTHTHTGTFITMTSFFSTSIPVGAILYHCLYLALSDISMAFVLLTYDYCIH